MHGVLKKVKRHPNGITREDAAAQKSENLIKRDFSASAPNQKWLSDITEVPCSDGKLYLSAVLDCLNGEIVGIAMDDNMRKELCIQSMSGTGRCYDNARMESFFATLKKEKLYKIKTEYYPMAYIKSSSDTSWSTTIDDGSTPLIRGAGRHPFIAKECCRKQLSNGMPV
ncbi:hypothetical protein PAESOLCIP111_06657 [Paenibacillus solanacearum]|uniref:Integrase catalytic domain-containing protein n=2 Tax=Paenibacillus solanacearum TaxID=2048548 RepID=A0A916KAV4_9BACL|nr:hypothetical protein PAESOLCIP111_06657 [Paenibacillus solanacearum]